MCRMRIVVFAAGIILGGSGYAHPQDADLPLSSSDETLSRQAWQARLEESRKRSQEFVSRAKSAPAEPLDMAKERALAQDQRIVNDESLQPGDIVSTSKGLYIFNGSSGQGRQPSDFSPVGPRQTN